jgi:signal peptidase II
MPDSSGSALKWLWISFVVVFIDQLTKWTAEGSLELGGEVYPVMPHLNFALAYNYGAAFSFLGDQGGWQRWFFSILAAVVSLVILVWLGKLKSSDKWTALGLVLVLGGAVGNLIDRVMYGRVIDFIDVYADWDVFFLTKWQDGLSHFATFNVADIAINIGAVILVIGSLFYNEEDKVLTKKNNISNNSE